MPSWTDSLKDDHRWTGRQLLGADETTDEEIDPMNNLLPLDVEFGSSIFSKDTRKRTIAVDSDSSDDDQEDSACLVSSPALGLDRTQESQPSYSQTGITRRTLLTVEEMEDSDDGYEEDREDQEELDDIHQTSLRIDDAASLTEIRDHDMLNRSDPTSQAAGDGRIVREQATSLDSPPGYAALDNPPDSVQASFEEPTQQSMAIDSGRIQESQENGDQRAAHQVIALKRKKKAIKYLEHVCLDFLQQVLDCLKLESKRVRRDVGEEDSMDEDEGDVQDDDDDASEGGMVEDKENSDEAKAGEISIPLLNRASGDLKYLRYPRKPGQSENSTSLALARFMRVCSLLHEALVDDVTVTKRDIFYKDVNLFGKQSLVDALIDDIVASVGLKRADFNVVASPKGLMAATGLKLCMTGGTETLGSTPALIPSNGRIVWIDKAQPPCWVLVIEKEATFTTLCGSGILADEELGNGILITGKGYPDLATLHFLRLLSDTFPSCPIAILVDADPHGLDILSVYQYGSKGMRYTAEAEGLALAERATWIGVKATEWSSMQLDFDMLIPISEKDQRFAQSMLKEEDVPVEWKRELSHMLHVRRKAEIQNLSNVYSSARLNQRERGVIDADACQDLEPELMGFGSRETLAVGSLYSYVKTKLLGRM